MENGITFASNLIVLRVTAMQSIITGQKKNKDLQHIYRKMDIMSAEFSFSLCSGGNARTVSSKESFSFSGSFQSIMRNEAIH